MGYASATAPAMGEPANRFLMGNHRVFESTDLDQTREHIARTYCPHHLSIAQRSGSLAAWLNHKRLTEVGLGIMSYGPEVAISGGEDQDFVLLMLPTRGATEIGLGRNTVQCDPGKAVVACTTELDRMRWSQDCSQLVVQISHSAINRHLTLLMGRPAREPLRFAPEMRLADAGNSGWNYVMLLLDEVSSCGAQDAQATVRHLETLLIVKLLESQASNYSDFVTPQAGSRIAPQHVRRVERYIVDNIEQPIALEDLVAVSGVSARALFDGFRRFRGQSPMALVRSLRLERVRQDLLDARPGDTVTSIACRWGFFQFGRFAGQYKQAFGESPSQTMRRRALDFG